MFKTGAIILRTTKYGETSLIVTAFTELFGLQSYMVNGVRTAKKSGQKASLYQPASVLDMEVYHNEKHTLHRIKECNRKYVFTHLQSDVVKNSIAIFMMELLNKLLKQPEENADMYNFCEDVLLQLDTATAIVAANIPLFFSLHLTNFFGFKLNDNYDIENCFLDLTEGNFVAEKPTHSFYIDAENALITSELLKIMLPSELGQIKLNHQKRRLLLQKYMEFYALHIQDFGSMKTLAIMQEVLS